MPEPAEPLIDLPDLGRRVKAARLLAGIDTPDELHRRLAAYGVDVSTRTLYKFERGEHTPSIDTMLALIATTRPIGGYAFFAPAVRGDARWAWERGSTPSVDELVEQVAARIRAGMTDG